MPKTTEEKIADGREYRDINVSEMEFRALDPSPDKPERIVEGYAAKFDSPYVLFDAADYKVIEQIDVRAFDGCDFSDVIMQYNHTGRVFARTSNRTLTVAVDGIGLHIRADLGGTEIGRQLYDEIRGGYTTKMSFAFRVAEQKREVTSNEDSGQTTVVRTITKIAKVYDVSAVSMPANDATEISARDFCNGVIAEIEAERLGALNLRRRRLQARIGLTKGV